MQCAVWGGGACAGAAPMPLRGKEWRVFGTARPVQPETEKTPRRPALRPGGRVFAKGPFCVMPPFGRRGKGGVPALRYFRKISRAWLVTPSRSARSQVAKW